MNQKRVNVFEHTIKMVLHDSFKLEPLEEGTVVGNGGVYGGKRGRTSPDLVLLKIYDKKSNLPETISFLFISFMLLKVTYLLTCTQRDVFYS